MCWVIVELSGNVQTQKREKRVFKDGWKNGTACVCVVNSWSINSSKDGAWQNKNTFLMIEECFMKELTDLLDDDISDIPCVLNEVYHF